MLWSSFCLSVTSRCPIKTSGRIVMVYGINRLILHCLKGYSGIFKISMLDLLTVGQQFTRPACRAAAAAVDGYLLFTPRPQQQTRQPPLLLSVDGTDRRSDGRTDTRPFDNTYRMLCGPRNKGTALWNFVQTLN